MLNESWAILSLKWELPLSYPIEAVLGAAHHGTFTADNDAPGLDALAKEQRLRSRLLRQNCASAQGDILAEVG
jgi:hypothetical protein